ncbi:MAG TPA: MFS transporter [Herpetosiphonaceae bacterium]
MSQPLVSETTPSAVGEWRPGALKLLLVGQFAIFGLVLGVQGVVWAEVMVALSLSEGVFGTAQFTLPLVGFVVLLFNGQLYLRLGNKRQSILSLLLLASAMLVLAAADHLWGLVVSLMLAGAGFAMLDAATNSAGIDLEQATGQHVMNVLHGISSGGVMLGAFLTGILLEAGWTYSLILLLSALICVPFILLTLPVRYPPAGQGESESADAAGGSFLRQALFIMLAAICFMGSAAEAIATVWAVIYLRGLEAPIAISGATFALFNAAMLIGRFLNAPLVARLGTRVSLLISGIGITVAAALLLLFSSISVAVVAFVLLGLAVAGVQPTVLSASAPLARNSGAVAAAVMMSAYAALLVAPPVYGWAAEFTSLRLAMLLVGVCGFLTTWLAVALAVRRAPEQQLASS